jgi:hypothetical protein
MVFFLGFLCLVVLLVVLLLLFCVSLCLVDRDNDKVLVMSFVVVFIYIGIIMDLLLLFGS